MLIGVPKEIKNHEYRVGMTPGSVREAVTHGHEVLVQTVAGAGIGASDADYRAAGARIADTAAEVWAQAQMIVKVKEPQAVERAQLRAGQTLFTYLHLAPDPEQTKDLVASGATCIAYETVTAANGGLPLLAPMSEVAGRMSIQAGASCLERSKGGRGLLLGGVPGVEAGKVLILGGGVVGSNAAIMAIGLGAQVVVIDRSVDVLRRLVAQFGTSIQTAVSTRDSIERHLADSDLVIGGVLIPGASAPKLVSKAMLKLMRPGAVIVDVAIDQGGCFETSRATTHAEPTYEVDGIVHYCVANMPGGVPRTSTMALNNVTLPFILELANKGARQALLDNLHLRAGLNVAGGKVTNAEVAHALGYEAVDPLTWLK
ncbi:alanine dehydrogenase [Roseateles toxinivorans]|uniref:Alanine dehydrogenase n=1 Tax=Roseateles toxinivorans TaxID=270368 RepID=A0A4R6QC55_9BURK|nr:alanine dehydrogenase [Roseateles toxinivorans]TDP59536.1 L-alanine dehydrogenase [Roseateles toxinivorans]